MEVPLGRGNTTTSGIVVAAGGLELADGLAIEKIKAVLSDQGTALTPQLVELARWMAEYYVCPLGMVLATMMPAAVKKGTGLRRVTMIDRVDRHGMAEVTEVPGDSDRRGAATDPEGLTASLRRVWAAASAVPMEAWPMPPAEAMLALGVKTMGPINRLVEAGLLCAVDAEEVRARGGVSGIVGEGGQMGIEQAAGSGLARDDAPMPTIEQARAIDGISAGLGKFGVHLLRGVTGSGKTEVYLRVLERVLATGKSGLVLVPEISLTPQTAGRFVRRFAGVGGGGFGVAVLHSGLTASQRHKEWRRVESGAARVIVGARSAVFAPRDDLGLVIVDEEHASDYKQDQLPRYHGRDVAIKRGQIAGCAVVLGSATPSLESWANAAGGKYALWTLTGRVGGARLPRVEVVDINEERRRRKDLEKSGQARAGGWMDAIGPTLEAAIGETLDDGGQVLLLLNRRGYASYVGCRAGCGFVLGCEECDARMVEHRVVAGKPPPKGLVRCHHCLAQVLLPERCPQCGAGVMCLGVGTQRLEEELERKFGGRFANEDDAEPTPCPLSLGGGEDAEADEAGPTPRPLPLGGGEEGEAEFTARPRGAGERSWMMRVDGDTMGSAKDYFEALSRFAAGDVRVLLGTQMIAKGLDFPNVRLVGVISADTALTLPDFRAGERTFQLVSQVAGRAGRGEKVGRVIVQTMEPESSAIQHAARHDYESFAREELETRAMAGLPPVTRMARIVLRDADLEKARALAERVAAGLKQAIAEEGLSAGEGGGADVWMFPPGPCAIARIAGQHRIGIEVWSRRRLALQRVLARVRARGLVKSDAKCAVDIDPIALM